MTRLARHIGLLFAALFLLAQGIATAHAGGPGPHDHDGVACAVTLIAEDQAVAPEPVLVETPVPTETAPVLHDRPVAQICVDAADTRAPPPRGPPA